MSQPSLRDLKLTSEDMFQLDSVMRRATRRVFQFLATSVTRSQPSTQSQQLQSSIMDATHIAGSSKDASPGDLVMVSSPTRGRALSSFTLFPKLPIEIRLMIWY